MKFKNDEALNTYLKDVEFEEHELVPYFIVDETSVFYDSSIENDEGLLVVDNFKTEVLDGIIYAKMDSTHKNMDGITFSGAEPTYIALSGNLKYSQERQSMWQEQFGDAISANTMMEVRRVAGLTLEEYKLYMIDKLNEIFDKLSEQGFQSDCLGEVKNFLSDPKSVAQINGMVTVAQQNMIDLILDPEAELEEVRWKTAEEDVCSVWTNEQIIKLGKDLARASKELEHNRELAIVAVKSFETREEIDAFVASLD